MSDPKQPPQQQQINIELGEKRSRGDLLQPCHHHSFPAEFVIDFTRVLPGVPKGEGPRAHRYDASAHQDAPCGDRGQHRQVRKEVR